MFHSYHITDKKLLETLKLILQPVNVFIDI